MNLRENCDALKKHITEKLTSVIDHNCCLLGLPYYHANIGDYIIWHGVEAFLRENDIQCDYRAAISTYNQKRISVDTIILLNGGGDFGDVWEDPQEFRRRIIKNHPGNKIVVLPQTVYYSNKQKLLFDAEEFGKHKNLVLCARDRESFEILNRYFSSNTVLLIPDMAFCIPYSSFEKYQKHQINRILFLKRIDKELNINIEYSKYIHDKNLDITDWPTIRKMPISFFLLLCFLWFNRHVFFLFSSLIDHYIFLFVKNYMIKRGVKFISKYRKVYTTRLHGAILCCLLDKSFVLFDNSYGKSKSFFETWLCDLEQAEFH